MDGDIKKNLIKKLKETFDQPLLRLEIKFVHDIAKLEDLKYFFCKLENLINSKNHEPNPSNKSKFLFKKYHSSHSFHFYQKHLNGFSEETDITNETKILTIKDKIKTPLMKVINNNKKIKEKDSNPKLKQILKINLNTDRQYNKNFKINGDSRMIGSCNKKLIDLNLIKNQQMENNKNERDFKKKKICKDFSKTISIKSFKSKYLKSDAPLEGLFFTNKRVKAIAIFTLSSFYNLKTRLYIVLLCKQLIYNFSKIKTLILEKTIFEYEKITFYLYSKISNYLEDENLRELINCPFFIPSKTAQNGLNFITTQQEKILLMSHQPTEIINFFKMIYVILNEDFSQLEDNKVIENFFQLIFKKYNADSLKTLFLNQIIRNINFSNEQIDFLNRFITDNPILIDSSKLLKFNKCISFLSFVLKEIIDYSSIKTDDGVYISTLRKYYMKYKQVKEKQKKLKNIVII